MLAESSVAKVADSQKNLCDALREELPLLFSRGPSSMDKSLYAPDVEFRDPLNRFRGVERYVQNIGFLNSSPVFSGTQLDLHDVWALDQEKADSLGYQGPTVRTRWTLSMVANLPWRPRISFTGVSDYVMEPQTGEVKSHIDLWDSLDRKANAAFPSLPGVKDVVSQCSFTASSPDQNGSPPYQLLRRADDYVIRRYGTLTVSDIPRLEIPLDPKISVDNSRNCLVSSSSPLESSACTLYFIASEPELSSGSAHNVKAVALRDEILRRSDQQQKTEGLTVAVRAVHNKRVDYALVQDIVDSMMAAIRRDNAATLNANGPAVYLACYKSMSHMCEVWVLLDKFNTRADVANK